MSSAVLDDNSPRDGTAASSTDAARHPLQDLDLNEAPESLDKQICDMLKTRLSLYKETLGVICATEHAIVPLTDALPIRAQSNRAGSCKRQIKSGQINEMLELNDITARNSAWVSPVVIVPKKNDTARFCATYGGLNSMFKKGAHPLPIKEVCLDSMADPHVFPSLDVIAG